MSAESISTKTPAISVCIPTYNYGRFLPDAIESILAQDFSDFEIVITDDASTDGTVDLVEAYQARDGRIRLIKNERRLGMNGNIQRAADLGRGQFIKMLCADDWLAPRCLSRMAALLSAYPTAVLATSACIVTSENGRPREVNFLYGRDVTFLAGDTMLARMSRGEGFGGNSSFFFRRDAYRRIGGYDGSRPYAADYDLAARLCQIGDYVHTDEALFYGRSQPDASSAKDPAKLLDVPDWFQIPAKVFQPRPVLSKSFWRYQRLTGLLTARYLVTVPTQYARGRREYATALAKMLLREGNFLAGVPLLPIEVSKRFYKRLTGTHRPRSRSPEPWMGPPDRPDQPRSRGSAQIA
jgi:glycosyltransferase involved in cell wall biosynthesis